MAPSQHAGTRTTSEPERVSRERISWKEGNERSFRSLPPIVIPSIFTFTFFYLLLASFCFRSFGRYRDKFCLIHQPVSLLIFAEQLFPSILLFNWTPDLISSKDYTSIYAVLLCFRNCNKNCSIKRDYSLTELKTLHFNCPKGNFCISYILNWF